MIVPFPPGGGNDTLARIVAIKLSAALGQQVVVDNRGGANGTIAIRAAARAAPDGYTLMVGYVGTHGTNPAVRKVPYDAVRDFTAIAMVGGTPNVLVVYPGLPVTDMKSLIAYANGNAGKMNYASGGIGTLNHLAMEQFRADAKDAGLPPILADRLSMGR
jgi:tripartite-type tricarboxylate transporter receptor subunit TctC